MSHVAKIKSMLDQGEVNEAQDALENLLELGPNNVEALKLKAFLYMAQGRFNEEEKVWQKVFEVDQEDPDAIEFLQRKHMEDREHYYFTDILPEGGRRYLAYPRTLVNISLIGLIGCISFLLLTRLSDDFEFATSPRAHRLGELRPARA